MEACLGTPTLFVRDWKISINVSKSAAMLSVKAARSIQKHIAVQFLGETIQLVETARYLGVTPDTAYLFGTRPRGAKEGSSKLGVFGTLINSRWDFCKANTRQ